MILTEAIIGKIIKAAARQVFKRKALTSNVTNPRTIRLPRTTTGFQTARGSKYTFSRKPNSWGTTQRTAVNDPTHPTPAGVKQKSDWTLFTTPDAAFDMKMRWREGASRKDFYKGLPLSPNPKKGRAAVEVWNQYQGGGRAIHNSNVITDLQTQGRKNTLPLYGQQRREIQQRVRAALGKEQNRNVLRREVKQGNEASWNNLYQMRNNPQNPNTLENELRGRLRSTPQGGRYRGKGVGRKETTNEQIAPLEKENQLPGKFSKIVVTTDTPADRMKSLKKRVGRYGKYLQKMSDIYPNYP